MTVPKSKKRLRPARGLGAGYTRTRRVAADKVRRMAEERKEAARADALAAMERAAAREARAVEMADQRFRHGVIRGVAKAAQDIIHAQGHEDITVEYGVDTHRTTVDAWTDFERIVVKWPADRIPADVMKHKEVLAEVRVIRGAFRHEAGHILYTTPWDVVMADSGASSVHAEMWNVLEDQRMENLVVEANPKAADDLKALVSELVIPGVGEDVAWLYIAGRVYLPKRLRAVSASLFDDRYGKGASKAWQELVDEYIAADTNERLGKAVIAAYQWLNAKVISVPKGFDGHTRQSNYRTNRGHATWASRSASYARTPGSSQYQYPNWSVHRGTSTDIDWDATTGTFGGGGATTEGGQSNGGSGLSFNEELKRVKDDLRKMDTTDRESARVARNATEASQHIGLPEYDGPVDRMTLEQEEVANAIAVGMEKALTSFITQSDPAWLHHQEHGVVDPLAYRVHGPGLRNYRRALQMPDDDNPLDVHISVLADASGSMGGNMVALSQVLYGTSLMAQKVGIGTSLGLWSNGNQNYRVWTSGDAEPVVFPSMGGTDPKEALDDLVNHNPEEAGNHLVIIFTDGAWGTFPTLQNWNGGGTGNRTIVLVRYGFHDGEFQGDMGADKHIQINDVLDLAGELTDALTDVLGAASGDWG